MPLKIPQHVGKSLKICKCPPMQIPPLLPVGPLADPTGIWGVAVSGGADSTALLHLLLAHGVPAHRLVVLHVNHGWSPAATDWQIHVQSLAQRLEIPFAATTLTGARPRTNAEALARTARWQALEAMAKKHALTGILTGHTRTDQVEQLLMRLGRGSSLQGLTGMAGQGTTPGGLPLARPLLQLEREPLRTWLREKGETWLEDPSNATSLRGRLRALIPQLEAAGLTQEAFAASITALSRANSYIEATLPSTAPPTLSQLRALHPEAALRTLAHLLHTTAGTAGPPVRTAKRLALLQKIQSAPTGTATLGGCQLRWNEAQNTLIFTPQNPIKKPHKTT